jgi:hypothetical protein
LIVLAVVLLADPEKNKREDFKVPEPFTEGITKPKSKDAEDKMEQNDDDVTYKLMYESM